MAIPPAEIRERLFSPGERCGWEFRDRRRFWQHFDEPPPRGVEPDPALWQRVRRIAASRRGAPLWGCLVALILLAILVPVTAALPAQRRLPLWVGAAGVAGLALLARPAWLLARERAARRRYEATSARAGEAHRSELAAWQERRDAHDRAQWARVDAIPEWGAVRTGPWTRRIDVFGGTLDSWEGLVTTFGSSMLATSPPLLVLDLSEGMVAEELCRLASASGRRVEAQLLPQQLASCDLLAGLDGAQLADVLVESIHGGDPEGGRDLRAMDARLLGRVCEALEPDLSMARLSEALLALMGQPGQPRHLSREEWDRVAGELFSADYVRQAYERLRAIEAHVHPLRELGSSRPEATPGVADLRCLAVGGAGQALATDLFADLALQWAARSLHARPQGSAGVLVVVGADRLARRHLQRLADLCDRRGVRLVYLFRDLEGDAARVLGSADATIFMRLGSAEQAERAARFIGRGHRLELSQVTRSHGGGDTHTMGESEAVSYGRTSRTFEPPTVTRSRSWGITSRYALESNWHYAQTEQRVYEYLVEPTWLQNLPEYALLLVQRGDSGPDLRPQPGSGAPEVRVADCNPDIVSLPRVSMNPLPDAGAAVDPALQPAGPARGGRA